MQELYGEKTEKPRPSFVSSFGQDDNDNDDDDTNETEDEEDRDDEELCNDASIDAIVTVKDKTTYTFKGRYYWKLTEDSIAKGYPRLISRDWEGLPNNVDAAFTWTNGKTYFFKDSEYWRFTNRELDSGYPKEISSGFEGIPDNIDAAFVWTGNEKIYFFKGSRYYKFDPEKKPPVSSAYPKPISNWEGIPDRIDDALRYSNGYTYFFKDGRYWRFDDTKFKVMIAWLKMIDGRLKHHFNISRWTRPSPSFHDQPVFGGLAAPQRAKVRYRWQPRSRTGVDALSGPGSLGGWMTEPMFLWTSTKTMNSLTLQVIMANLELDPAPESGTSSKTCSRLCLAHND